MRRLWQAAAWVSRSQARTRRSSAALGASGSCSGCSPVGSTSGSRARVSASMPLDLAWRDNTRRRSWAVAELTRYTVCPRAPKNTAIGSHDGPVGSTTTSRQSPGIVPTRAACSTSTRLAGVGTALGRHTIVPSPESTRTVWALVIPRSMPTNRRSSMAPPCSLWPAPAAPMGGAGHDHGPRWLGPTTAPTHVLQPARPRQTGPLPSSGASVAGQGWQSGQRGMATARRPQSCTQRHPRNQPGCACNPGTRCGSSTAVPYMRLLVRSGDRWEATADLAHVPIPAGVSALLAARLDRLDVEERAVLERASVVGQAFDRQAVVALSPEPARPAVGPRLAMLVRRQLIRAEGADDGADGDAATAGPGGFQFRHLLIRDVTHEALPKRRRAELHERLADWLGREDGEVLPEHDEIAGHHFEQAYRYLEQLGRVGPREVELAMRGARRLASGGRRAMSRDDPPAAVNLLSRALDLLPSGDPDRVGSLLDLGDAFAQAGEWRRAQEVLAEAVDGAQLAGDRLLSARGAIALLYLREVTEPRGWTEQAEREAGRAIALFERSGDRLASPTAGGSSPMSTTAGSNGRSWSGSGSASSATPAGRGIGVPRRAFWGESRRACVLGRRRPGRHWSAASGFSQNSAGRRGRP